MRNVLRTPEDRFENLTDYNFKPHYLPVETGLRMHYLDEGKTEGPVVLLLHGEPTWSYLYRKMIPELAHTFRVVVPDLIGFGKSDKPTETRAYTYQNHLAWLKTFLITLDLTEILLFCQDWGGLTGLRLVAEMPERFSMVVASNTTLPTGQHPIPEAFIQWREFARNSENFNIGKVVDSGTVKDLPPEVIAAYNAPFPSEEYKAGARIFPSLVPVDVKDAEAVNNGEAWKILQQWDKPFLTIFGSEDPIMKGADKAFQKYVPGALNQAHQTWVAGHFIQEEKGAELARAILEFYQKNSRGSTAP